MTEKNYVIYKLECLTDISGVLLYVGSTSNFRERKYTHKCMCNKETGKWYNNPVYQMIRENGGWDNWQMKPIEELPNATKIQSLIREQYWIEYYKNNINERNAYMSPEDKKVHYNLYMAPYMREYRLKKKNQTNNIDVNNNQTERSSEIMSDGNEL
jgi:hypothetical protein